MMPAEAVLEQPSLWPGSRSLTVRARGTVDAALPALVRLPGSRCARGRAIRCSTASQPAGRGQGQWPLRVGSSRSWRPTSIPRSASNCACRINSERFGEHSPLRADLDEPAREGHRFRPNMIVTVESLGTNVKLEAGPGAHSTRSAKDLDRLRMINLDPVRDGRPASTSGRFTHYLHDHFGGVNLGRRR